MSPPDQILSSKRLASQFCDEKRCRWQPGQPLLVLTEAERPGELFLLDVKYTNEDYIVKVLLTALGLLIWIRSLRIRIPCYNRRLPSLDRFGRKCS